MDKNKLILFAAIGAAAFYFFMNRKKAGSDDFEEEEEEEEFIPRTPEQQAAETSQRPKTREEQQTSSLEDFKKSQPTILEVPKKIIVGDSKPFDAPRTPFKVVDLISLGERKQNQSSVNLSPQSNQTAQFRN